MVSTSTGSSLSPMDLGDIHSEHDRLGLHVPTEAKEKIWKGTYVVGLLVDKSEKEEVTRCKECAHSREYSHCAHKKKVDETLANWARGFSTYQAILAEHFNDLGAQLACYQNRIVGAHDAYSGTAFKDFDKRFGRVKANRPILGWDQIDIITWLQFINQPHSATEQPFRARLGLPVARHPISWDL
ncbi:hypothetical protein NDU88_000901 [Pleurodeles waltl]|uniref:Uncharacterized protein n=1 Tax=Pleurodeles waltl TaxID=8319 RepID=A0AAV7SY11_PLEWA|nr:hypothetical protein NDU88_000901 [Pleurodeles waltl]